MKLTTARLKRLIREELQKLNEMNSSVQAWNNELSGADARMTVSDQAIRMMVGDSGMSFEDYLVAVKKAMVDAGQTPEAIQQVQDKIHTAYDTSLDTRDARMEKGEI